jgi:hypothetical protein
MCKYPSYQFIFFLRRQGNVIIFMVKCPSSLHDMEPKTGKSNLLNFSDYSPVDTVEFNTQATRNVFDLLSVLAIAIT